MGKFSRVFSTGNYLRTHFCLGGGVVFFFVCCGALYAFLYQKLTSVHVVPGARPERLPSFDEECWQLMEACWNGDPNQRPLLGIVEPSLQSIMVRLCNCGSEQKSSSLEDSN